MLMREIRVGPWRKTAVLAGILICSLIFYATRPLPDHALEHQARDATSQLSSSLIPVGKDHFIRSLQGGVHSNYEYLLIHGADRVRQSAQHWHPHFSYFTEQGWMQAIDLLGYGEAQPGAEDVDVEITKAEQDEALATLLGAPTGGHAKRVVVARSWGAAVVLGALAHLTQETANVHALIFIAPALNPRLLSPPQWVADIPTLLIWAHEDETVPAVRAPHVKKAFTHSRLVVFRGLSTDDHDRAHNPENERIEQFHAEVFGFLTEVQANALLPAPTITQQAAQG